MHHRQFCIVVGERRDTVVLVVTLDDVLIRLCGIGRQTAAGHTILAHTHPLALAHSQGIDIGITSELHFHWSFLGTTSKLHWSYIRATSELGPH